MMAVHGSRRKLPVRGTVAALALAVAALVGPAANAGATVPDQATGVAPPLVPTSEFVAMVQAQIPMPGTDDALRGPFAIASTPDAVWAAIHRGGEVVRIDPDTNQIVARVAVPVPGCLPGACFGLEGIAADGHDVWVVNNQTKQLVHIDARRNQVVGAVATATTTWWRPVIEGRHVWAVLNDDSGDLARIDARSNRVTATVHLGLSEMEPLALAHGKLWVSGKEPGAPATSPGVLVRIDPQSARIEFTNRKVGGGPGTVADGDLWVRSYNGTTVTRVDGRTGKVLDQIEVGEGAGAFATTGGGSVWFRLELPDRLVRIDPTDDSVTVFDVQSLSMQGSGGISYGHGALWYSYWEGNTVYRVRPPAA